MAEADFFASLPPKLSTWEARLGKCLEEAISIVEASLPVGDVTLEDWICHRYEKLASSLETDTVRVVSFEASKSHQFLENLPDDRFSEREEELVQTLLTALGQGPLAISKLQADAIWKGVPMIAWINQRLGEQVEVFEEDGVPMAKLLEETSLEADAEEFFASLPESSFSEEEEALREAVVAVLAKQPSHTLMNTADLKADDKVASAQEQFLPAPVSLQSWLNMRIGGELDFIGESFKLKEGPAAWKSLDPPPPRQWKPVPRVWSKVPQIVTGSAATSSSHSASGPIKPIQPIRPLPIGATASSSSSHSSGRASTPAISSTCPAGSSAHPAAIGAAKKPRVVAPPTHILKPQPQMQQAGVGGGAGIGGGVGGKSKGGGKGDTPEKADKADKGGKGEKAEKRGAGEWKGGGVKKESALAPAEERMRDELITFLKEWKMQHPGQAAGYESLGQLQSIKMLRSEVLHPDIPLHVWISRRLQRHIRTWSEQGRWVLALVDEDHKNSLQSQPKAAGKKENGAATRPVQFRRPEEAGKESRAFFASLPGGHLNEAEVRVRDLILQFFASWKGPGFPRIAQLCSSDGFKEACEELFKGKAVTLHGWIALRLQGVVQTVQLSDGQRIIALAGMRTSLSTLANDDPMPMPTPAKKPRLAAAVLRGQMAKGP